MKSRQSGNGLALCQEALQRLIDGGPVVSEHIGLDLSRITASIVSLEAGFDRGYLKKSRASHLPILARIEACRMEANNESHVSRRKETKLESKLAQLNEELVMVTSQRDRVLAQNLQLWARIREFELIQKSSLRSLKF